MLRHDRLAEVIDDHTAKLNRIGRGLPHGLTPNTLRELRVTIDEQARADRTAARNRPPIFRGHAHYLMAENFDLFVMPANVSPRSECPSRPSRTGRRARAHHA
jgi:hypothetical protein